MWFGDVFFGGNESISSEALYVLVENFNIFQGIVVLPDLFRCFRADPSNQSFLIIEVGEIISDYAFHHGYSTG